MALLLPLPHLHDPPPRMLDISSSLADGEPSLNPLVNGVMQNGNRFRGVSVDRHREYQTPQYYEENYYKRDPYDSSGPDDERYKYDSLPGRYRNGGGSSYGGTNQYDGFDEHMSDGRGEDRTIFKLERQWSHPNLRPRPHGMGPRRLPKTPKQPPGIVIPTSPVRQDEHFQDWIENERMRRTPMLPQGRQGTSFEGESEGCYSPPPRIQREMFSPPGTRARRTPVQPRRDQQHVERSTGRSAKWRCWLRT